MCGIAGFFDFKNTIQDKEHILGSMMEAIKHRGPDDEGRAVDDWYGLGHVRLAILDPSPLGHQPMSSADGRYMLVYNGEIYNFHEIRAQLEAKGYAFKSNSDTETLLYGLIEWGAACLSKLEGMFAGVFFDTRTQEALCFRDQLGIKPFFYVQDAGRFVFASEVKGLWPAWGDPKLNHDAVFEQFHFRMVAGEETLFQDVKRLRPGTYLVVKRTGQIESHCYYDHEATIIDSPAQHADLEQIETLINQSIQAHTLSDVGYAVQLSGGVDSSYITHVLSQDKPDLEAYSISLPEFPDDEGPYQEQVTRQCDTQLHQFSCGARDFADLLPKATQALDFPIIHGGSVFLYFLCEHIAKSHKVVLTGEGADELFGGYSRYDIPRVHHLAFKLKQLGMSPDIVPNLPKLRGLKNLMQRDMGIDAGAFDSDVMQDLIHPLTRQSARYDVPGRFSSLLGQMMAVDQTAYLGSLLERQDKISMAHGVEVRVPFCNHKLFMLINQIRMQDKVKPVPKAILKALLAKHFPHDFVYRRKNGFKLPFGEWLRDPKGLGLYVGLLTEPGFKAHDFVDHKRSEIIIDDHMAGRGDYAKELYALVTFALWAKGAGV